MTEHTLEQQSASELPSSPPEHVPEEQEQGYRSYLESITRSQMVPAGALEECINTCRREAHAWQRPDPNGRDLIREFIYRLGKLFVERGHLTLLQAQTLLGKRPDEPANPCLLQGRYLLENVISGEGGMSSVYVARELQLRQKVVVKSLNDQSASKLTITRYRREVKNAREAGPETGVTAYEYFELPTSRFGRYFIVMEYVMAPTLAEMVKETAGKGERVPVISILEIAESSLRALIALQKKGIVHRDIKPSNIFVEEDIEGTRKKVRLCDFGLALDTAHPDPEIENLPKTETGAILGTSGYISPEQAQDSRRATTRSDVYSLGLTFYYLITGKHPFAPEQRLLKLIQLQETGPRPSLTAADLQGRSTADAAVLRQFQNTVLLPMIAVEPAQRPDPKTALEHLRKIQKTLRAQSALDATQVIGGSRWSLFRLLGWGGKKKQKS